MTKIKFAYYDDSFTKNMGDCRRYCMNIEQTVEEKSPSERCFRCCREG